MPPFHESGTGEKLESLLADLSGQIVWRKSSEKTRELRVQFDADLASEHWDGLYAWLVTGLLRMRAVAGLLRDPARIGA